METTTKLQKCLDLGGNEWIKKTESKNYHRVYFNDDVVCKIAGIHCVYYGTGSIQAASRNGKVISNNQARKLISRITFNKTYYDVIEDKFICHNDVREDFEKAFGL